eukprot:SAG11_NODE_3663_length_2301_cov_1.770209_2_plen_113_part_00
MSDSDVYHCRLLRTRCLPYYCALSSKPVRLQPALSRNCGQHYSCDWLRHSCASILECKVHREMIYLVKCVWQPLAKKKKMYVGNGDDIDDQTLINVSSDFFCRLVLQREFGY